MSYIKEIVRDGYKVVFEEPELYVDNQKRKRSGHMTHAMACFAEDTFIDFNSNCAGLWANGHSPYGWIEYHISKDAGKTYSPVYELECSKECFIEGFYTSLDGYTWDEGAYFSDIHGSCHYSNNLNLKDEQGNFLLVQFSEVYEACRVNVKHVKLRIEKT